MIMNNKKAKRLLRKAVSEFKAGGSELALKLVRTARSMTSVYQDTVQRIWDVDGLWIKARCDALESLIDNIRLGR